MTTSTTAPVTGLIADNIIGFARALRAAGIPVGPGAVIVAQAFDLFFRAAEDWKHMLDSVPLPDHAKKKPPPASRRVQEALSQPRMSETPQAEAQELRLSVSDTEVLQKKDFAQMSAAEIAEVTRAIEKM